VGNSRPFPHHAWEQNKHLSLILSST
jgi:hypothetical protein